MNKILFLSDYFFPELIGGAEKCNESLIAKLNNEFLVEKISCKEVTPNFILQNKSCFFIVANFFLLSPESKLILQDECKYLIYEHDHKYINTNNPIHFRNFLAPSKSIINREFYRNATKVVCQSRLHSETVYKNLLIDNIVNAAGNFWSPEDLDVLKDNIGATKNIEYASMDTENKNKGLEASKKFANDKGIDLFLMPFRRYKEFIETLARVENFVFFPQWMESYSRVSVEAKILNCKIVTNRLLGAASEDYFELSGQKLLDRLIENNSTLIKKITSIVNGEEVSSNFDPPKFPKISISCSVYDGDEYIRHFLEDITKQTVFEKCELIIINANSPGNEEEVIMEYCNRYENIIYHKLDYRATTTETINLILKEFATGDFITVGNVDDRRRYDCLEVQAKHLMFNEDVDLVYSDCLQTKEINETFESNSSDGGLYGHSKNKFSKENMIKCLPGPMPMWRRKIHDEIGLFSYEYDYANDWDMWLRMVDAGSKFKKIEERLGLYLFNEKGRSTSKETFALKIKEEAKLFFKYKHIFGEKNFQKYQNHFSQGL